MKRSIAIIGLLAGCGEGMNENLAEAEQPVIVGSVNWTSTEDLDKDSVEGQSARAIGYLSIPANGSRCTAWLYSKNRIITNEHCVGSEAEAVGARATFDYVDSIPSAQRTWWDCSTLVKAFDLDMAVLECAPKNGKSPGDVYGWVELASQDPKEGQEVYLIHQNCDYKREAGCSPTRKYSGGKILDATLGARDASYDCDTLGGSSGSALFAKSGPDAGKVVALHHLGYGSDAEGRGNYNSGIRVSLVKDRLSQLDE
jgi:hypothetical protein